MLTRFLDHKSILPFLGQSKDILSVSYGNLSVRSVLLLIRDTADPSFKALSALSRSS